MLETSLGKNNPYTQIFNERLEENNEIVSSVDVIDADNRWKFIVIKGARSLEHPKLRRFSLYSEIISDAIAAVDLKFYDTRLHIDNMEVSSEFRRRGLGTLMMAKALELQPNIETILGTPAQDNKAIYLAALEDGLSEEDAIRRMPFSRSCSALGFTQQRIDKQGFGGFELIASKPNAEK